MAGARHQPRWRQWVQPEAQQRHPEHHQEDVAPVPIPLRSAPVQHDEHQRRDDEVRGAVRDVAGRGEPGHVQRGLLDCVLDVQTEDPFRARDLLRVRDRDGG